MKNPAASVRARLLNLARETGEPFNSLIEQYATGRFLYRLANSPYRERFVLKGAQLFRVWGAEQHRPTRDLDLLGFGESSEEALCEIFMTILQAPTDIEDGLVWGNVRTGPIRDDLDYGGVRATIEAHLAGARMMLQVDIGFGDAITPEPLMAQWQELLDFPSAQLLIYPPETVIAEKLEAAITLGMNNSRMKDFFDLMWLAQHQSFSGNLLIASVTATFARRGTAIPNSTPLALTDAFSSDSRKDIQWKAFCRKGRLPAPALSDVTESLARFLMPILTKAAANQTWEPHSGWSPESK